MTATSSSPAAQRALDARQPRRERQIKQPPLDPPGQGASHHQGSQLPAPHGQPTCPVQARQCPLQIATRWASGRPRRASQLQAENSSRTCDAPATAATTAAWRPVVPGERDGDTQRGPRPLKYHPRPARSPVGCRRCRCRCLAATRRAADARSWRAAGSARREVQRRALRTGTGQRNAAFETRLNHPARRAAARRLGRSRPARARVGVDCG